MLWKPEYSPCADLGNFVRGGGELPGTTIQKSSDNCCLSSTKVDVFLSTGYEDHLRGMRLMFI